MVQEANNRAPDAKADYPTLGWLNRVGTKLALSMGLLLGLFVLVALASVVRARIVNEKVTEVTQVHQPTSNGAQEMEVNLIDTGFGVLEYLHDHNQRHLERIEAAESKFESYREEYGALANFQEGKALGAKVDEHYAKFKDAAAALITIEDQQTQK